VKIQHKIVLIPLGVMVFITTLSFFVLESALETLFENRIRMELKRFASLALESLYEKDNKRDFHVVDDLADHFGALSEARITFMDTEGLVLGDSDLHLEEVKHIENHAKRPEVMQAIREGFGISKRYSTSMKQDMLYVAVFRKLEPESEFHYLARASVSLKVVSGEMMRLRWMFVVIGLMSLGVVSLLGWFSGRTISKAVQGEQDHLERRVQNRTREISSIQTMGGMLNACASIDEVAAVISNIMPGLFPHMCGATSVIKASRNRLEILTAWGEHWPGRKHFSPNECWALKKGHQHFSHSESIQIPCPHLQVDLSVQSLCVPLLAQTETIGVFHLLSDEAPLSEENTRLVTPLVKQIGLALANIQLRDHLREQAIRDPLTGLYNRRYMMESLEQFISRAKRKQSSVAVMMIDFDHFKRFNDTFGHEAGDFVLINVAREMKRNIRTEDIVCRYGGEEFCLVCPEMRVDNAVAIANKLGESIRRLDLRLNKKSLGGVSISIGVSVFPTHADTVEALLKLADEALYRAKAEGRDRTRLADLEIETPVLQAHSFTDAPEV